MIRQDPGYPVRSALRPSRPYCAKLIAKQALQREWKFRAELFEERSQVGLQPVNRLVGAADEE